MAAGRMTRNAAAAALTVLALLTAEAALAQNPQALFPPNVILPNNNRLARFQLPVRVLGAAAGRRPRRYGADPDEGHDFQYRDHLLGLLRVLRRLPAILIVLSWNKQQHMRGRIRMALARTPRSPSMCDSVELLQRSKPASVPCRHRPSVSDSPMKTTCSRALGEVA